MEYRIEALGAQPSAEALIALLESEDPASLADFDGALRTWRISTSLGPRGLLDLFARAGWRVSAEQLRLQPSVCCGGCSG